MGIFKECKYISHAYNALLIVYISIYSIDKKIISIEGKKEEVKAYFEGEIVDG